jgi:two-component system, OmpR family, phosphate regulon response regulator PhoB
MSTSVLIVENEQDIADVIRRYLEFERFTTTWAASCDEARTICAAHLPDIILCDWRLPDTDGDEWIAELRGQTATADIPIVMMTGGYPTSTLVAEMNAARVPILIKPFSLDLLVEHIRRMTTLQRAIGV